MRYFKKILIAKKSILLMLLAVMLTIITLPFFSAYEAHILNYRALFKVPLAKLKFKKYIESAKYNPNPYVENNPVENYVPNINLSINPNDPSPNAFMVPNKHLVEWVVKIEVKNNSTHSVLIDKIKDVFPAEYIIYNRNRTPNTGAYSEDPSTWTPGHMRPTKITWSNFNLAANQTATLKLWVRTNINGSGKFFEFTTAENHTLNEGAKLYYNGSTTPLVAPSLVVNSYDENE